MLLEESVSLEMVRAFLSLSLESIVQVREEKGNRGGDSRLQRKQEIGAEIKTRMNKKQSIRIKIYEGLPMPLSTFYFIGHPLKSQLM